MQETTTIIAFYHGAYGPTIRIDIQDIAWLKLLQKKLGELISKNISELDLLKLDNVKKDKISGFKIVLGYSLDLSIISNNHFEEYPMFIWIVDARCMDYAMGAVECYLDCNKPGHHYLYEDEFVIELAYKEERTRDDSTVDPGIDYDSIG